MLSANRATRARFAYVSQTQQLHAGMMLGLQLETPMKALTLSRALLERGYLVLPAGTRADVLQLAPPVTVSDAQLGGFVASLQGVLEEP